MKRACATSVRSVGGSLHLPLHLLVGVFLFLSPAAGCAWAPSLHHHGSEPILTAPPADPQGPPLPVPSTEPGTASLRALGFDPRVFPPVGDSLRTSSKPRPVVHRIPTPEPHIETPEPLPSPSTPPEDSVLSVDLPPEQRAFLLERIRRDLDEARQLLQSADTVRLSPDDTEKERTVRHLIGAAQQARERSRLQEAGNLAHKAKLLASELTAP